MNAGSGMPKAAVGSGFRRTAELASEEAKWSMAESNRRPRVCDTRALPTELMPHAALKISAPNQECHSQSLRIVQIRVYRDAHDGEATLVPNNGCAIRIRALTSCTR